MDESFCSRQTNFSDHIQAANPGSVSLLYYPAMWNVIGFLNFQDGNSLYSLFIKYGNWTLAFFPFAIGAARFNNAVYKARPQQPIP